MSSEVSGSELISKAFLEKALGRKVKSFTIKAGSDLGDNYMSILYALDVRVSSNDPQNVWKEETLHLISKCYPTNPARQTFLNKANIFWKELVIYEKWIPTLTKFQEDLGIKEIVKPAFAPLVAGSAVDFDKLKDENNNMPKYEVYKPFDIFIMMVDLRKTWGFKMADRMAGLDIDHAVLAINSLAEIHALSWIFKQKNNIKRIVEKFPTIYYEFSEEDNKMFEGMMHGSMKTLLDVVREKAGEDSPQYKSILAYKEVCLDVGSVFYDYGPLKETDLDNMLRIKSKRVDDSEEEIPWKVVIHGDCWINNMLFRYNEATGKPEQVILVDLQMCRDACPTTDLAYFIYVSTDSEFRKNHLDNILKIYADRFISICDSMDTKPLPGFSFQELKRRFNRTKLFGLSMATFCLPIMLKDKKDVKDLEKATGGMEEIFTSMGEGGGGNTRCTSRLMGVIQDLYDDGVI